MRNIEKYIEDHAQEDLGVHLSVELMSTGEYRARLLGESGCELLDRNGEHYMVARADVMEDAITELDQLAGAMQDA